MKECNRICEWNNPSNGCVKPETVDCKMPNLFKGAKPQTNADRIRAMSDVELAAWLADDSWDCNNCSEHERLSDNPLLRNERCDEKCAEHCLDWLRQPVKEET